jgi:hypothetical protein
VLTGDWLGLRTVLAESGVTLVADNVQVYQGVTSGGLDAVALAKSLLEVDGTIAHFKHRQKFLKIR